MTKCSCNNIVTHHSPRELKAAVSAEGSHSLTVYQLFGNPNNKQWSPQAPATQNISQHMRQHYWHFLFRIYFKKLSHLFPFHFLHLFSAWTTQRLSPALIKAFSQGKTVIFLPSIIGFMNRLMRATSR